MSEIIDCIVIGGGASGFFFAINYAERHPDQSVMILEKSKQVLQKVKISGGGRCNVTHAEFIPKDLSKHYPRGERELIGPFHRFMTGDMMAWLEQRGVALKIEDDGRIFPKSDSSQSIIDCFVKEANRLRVSVKTSQVVTDFNYINNHWQVTTKTHNLEAQQLVISTGSSLKIWKKLEQLGHEIVTPIPSLFTFNIHHTKLTQLQGLSLPTHIKLFETTSTKAPLLESTGATLITHWGLSGPCILKLSAWGAQLLNKMNYHFVISVNWLPDLSEDEVNEQLKRMKFEQSKKQLNKQIEFNVPKRFWLFILEEAEVNSTKNWGDLSKLELNRISTVLRAFTVEVNGKSTFKDEFVTAGGVHLKEIDFKTFRSKQLPQLKIIGEALNIDAITGGFNFQNTWTSAYIAATTN
ncbi:NAD(P)/FAD-dependent oxidoreductase [Psychroflexus sp. ALD_RP9]|uniref:NAD(P)/FAD-dependent oxidoreductase n=1 Tax=Psychroflexus sp. ALD_RP9 TaxID=2777186 RepID=UPI001A8D1183|nr:NAD(P)/FAD-dependent oxidoreductase [Psychroflexus sp. ALD_RP9]QSS97833.1 NAD(P)/FAD-dependent oxidoreductase [Psychroflexus sp. ALD_RP9]